jgi:hypothetical protein
MDFFVFGMKFEFFRSLGAWLRLQLPHVPERAISGLPMLHSK